MLEKIEQQGLPITSIPANDQYRRYAEVGGCIQSWTGKISTDAYRQAAAPTPGRILGEELVHGGKL